MTFLLTLLLALLPQPRTQTGWHTWYGAGNFHGNITANGEVFDPHGQTCASRHIKLNSLVIVHSLETGNFTSCRVNDRGPYGAKLHNGEWAIMYKRKGVWHTKHKNPVSDAWNIVKTWLKRPGRWRGVMDLSLGTARALYGTDGRPPNGKVKIYYWR